MMKHVNFKERKKGGQIKSKRSAVIPTLQNDPPLSHKGVDLPMKLCYKYLEIFSGRLEVITQVTAFLSKSSSATMITLK